MSGPLFILLAIFFLYMATSHPTETWTYGSKTVPAPRGVVLARKFVEGRK